LKNNKQNRLTLKFFHRKFFLGFLMIIILQFSLQSWTRSNKHQSNSPWVECHLMSQAWQNI